MTRASSLPTLLVRLRGEVAQRRTWPVLGVLVVALVGVTGLLGALGTSSSPTKAPGSAYTPSTQIRTQIGAARQSAKSLSFSAALAAGVPPAQHGAAGSGSGQPGGTSGPSARIEETGAITIIVRGAQIQADLNRLTSLAVATGGFVASTSTQSAMEGAPAQGTVTLQVPEASFGDVLQQVKAFGKVASLTTTATDVTGQYVDLQAQITALEGSRQQYLTIMTKATTIGGILAVQSQLDNLQSQLDELQGQLKVLDNQTTYATLVVTLSPGVLSPPPPKPTSGLLRAWRAAVGGFVAGCEGVVRLAGPLLFALLLAGALFLLGRLAWRLSRRSDATG